MEHDIHWRGMVTAIAADRELVHALLSRHVDDGTGRCPACVTHGQREVWPCPIRQLAAQAATQLHPGRPR